MNQKTDTKWTEYLAVGIAEGFENGTKDQQVEAWAFLIETKIAYSLQGWFGRTAEDLINSGVISRDGTIDWDMI